MYDWLFIRDFDISIHTYPKEKLCVICLPSPQDMQTNIEILKCADDHLLLLLAKEREIDVSEA